MTTETIFRNTRIVLPDEVVTGSVAVRGGLIAAIDEGPSSICEYLQGDFLMPGLIELHTDHLESHYAPRPGVRWHLTSAVQSHDAQIATSGITTVFDCLRMGSDGEIGFDPDEMRTLADAIDAAQQADRLRAEHFLADPVFVFDH